MRDHSPVELVLLVTAALLLAPVVGTVVVSAAPVEHDTYAVAQGTSCTVVEPVTDESQNASAFYDYRNPDTDPSSSEFSSFGTQEYQETSTSALFFYEGDESGNLVLVHDELGDEAGGSTLTMAFEGLPADGEWVVEDDDYENRDDDWNTGGTTADIDWKWGENRTDGGVYSGVGNMSGTITITPGFNEDAAHWGDWGKSGEEQYRLHEWRLIDADGSETTLDRDRQLFIHGGGCEETPPTAALTGPSNAETDETVTLDAGETTDDGTIGGYEWDLDGDGETDRVTTDPTLDHAFSDAGEHTVAVTAFDTYGNGDTAELAVNVTQPPEPPDAALDAPAEVEVNTTLTLDASASTDDGAISRYEWDLDGDGEVEQNTTEATLDHSYNETGTVEPTVTVVDEDGERDSASATIEVLGPNQPPNASLDAPETVDEGDTVTLDASDSTDDRGIETYRWDADGDGEFEDETDESTFEYTYADPGNVTAEVVVVDGDGETDRANASITVQDVDDPPTAELTAVDEVRVNETVTFDASESNDDEGIQRYGWDLDGDGAVDRNTTDPTLDYTYNTTVADLEVSVTVEDTSNQTDSASTTLDVVANAPPTAALSAPDEATVNETVTFDASESSDDEGIDRYAWDVDGDGEIDRNTSEPTVDYAYTTTGTYDVTVTVVDTDGETDSAAATTTVVEPAEPNESLSVTLDAPATATVNESVSLSAAIAGGGDDDEEDGDDEFDVERYEWDVDGDGEADRESEDSTIDHAFPDAGSVTVGVTVVGEDGETANANSTVVVGDPAAANTSIAVVSDDPTADEPVSFEAAATAATEITSYEWQFGDGTTGSGASVQHTYSEAGSYEVTLEITTEGGVTNSATTTVTIGQADTENGGNDDGGNGDAGDGGTDPPDNGDSNNSGNDGGDGNDGQNNAGGGQQGGGQQGGSQDATPEPEPDIGQANVSIATDRLLTGETLVVEATVQNDGDATGTKTVEFEVESEILEERVLTLAPGERRTVTFEHEFDSPGEKAVEVDHGRTHHVQVEAREPNLTVSALEVNKRQVDAGEEFTLTATISNDGTAAGERAIALELFGEQVASQNVSVPVGETAEVSFTRSVISPGSYEATVGNESVTVEVVRTETTEQSDPGTATEAPGFGVVTAALALLAVVLALRRRD